MSVQVLSGPGGPPLAKLSAADFLLEGKGIRPQPVSARAGAPLDVLLLLQEDTGAGTLRAAGRQLMEELRQEDRVALISFGHSSRRLLKWTGEFDALGEALERAEAAPTPMYFRSFEAVLEAVKLFPPKVSPNQPFRKGAVLMLAEEWDETGDFRPSDVLPPLISRRAPLYLVALPPRQRGIRGALRGLVPRNRMPPQRPGMAPAMGSTVRVTLHSVSDLAGQSGGDVLPARDSSSLSEMLARIRAGYQITYCSEKKSSDYPPSVALTLETRKRYPAAVLQFPGARAEFGAAIR